VRICLRATISCVLMNPRDTAASQVAPHPIASLSMRRHYHPSLRPHRLTHAPSSCLAKTPCPRSVPKTLGSPTIVASSQQTTTHALPCHLVPLFKYLRFLFPFLFHIADKQNTLSTSLFPLSRQSKHKHRLRFDLVPADAPLDTTILSPQN